MPSIGAPVNQMTALSQLLQANPSAFAALVAASAGGNLRPSAPSLPAAGSGIYPPPPFASVGRGRGVVSHPPPPPPLLPGGGGRGRGRGLKHNHLCFSIPKALSITLRALACIKLNLLWSCGMSES